MKINFKHLFIFAILAVTLVPIQQAETTVASQYWMKIRASDKFQRSVIADLGVSIERVEDDYVVATGNLEEMKAVEKTGWMDVSFPLTESMDFPEADAEYHNYSELISDLVKLKETYPTLTDLFPIGKTV